MTDDDLVIDRDEEKGDVDDSTGQSDTKTKRTNVHVKTRMGTQLYKHEQNCFHCDERADGVLAIGNGDSIGTGVPEVKVLCDEHKKVVMKEQELEFMSFRWHSFVEEVDE